MTSPGARRCGRVQHRTGKGTLVATLKDRPHTALLVIDVQNGVVAGAHDRDRVVANVNTLVDKARAANVPVVWVQHSDDGLQQGSEEWRIVPELRPKDDEPLVHKNYGDSFEDTNLEAVLAERGVGRLVVDAHTTEDLTEWGAPPPDLVIAHTNLYWGEQAAPGRRGRTVETSDVDFAGAAQA